MEIEALHEEFGARISGVDLTGPLSADLVETLHAAVDEHSVLLFTAQKDFRRFARAFPPLEKYFRSYIDETFGGPDKAFAPGNIKDGKEDEHGPQA